jgi:uncharacterized protein with ParB-like and HNH nuclease domain
MAKKLSDDLINQIELQIKEESIPYIYDTKEYPVEVLVAKFDKDQIFVPHYQREFIWDNKQKSRFVESVFLGVPIMPMLVSVAGEEAELEIIDGSQRIRTLVDYVQDRLKLRDLKKLQNLNGTKFSQLSPLIKNKFLLRDFRFHVVTDKALPEIRADIFDRVNTSSKKLSYSEVRKGAFQGGFYDFILDMAKSEQLQKVCPIPEPKAKRGEYEELLLRFFTYSENYLNFKHDVSPFLDEYLKAKNKTGFDRDEKEKELIGVLDFVEKHFAPPFFARKGRDNATPRVRFEAISIGVFLALKEEINLTPTYMDWLDSDEFKEYTTTDASNNPGKLKGRIEFVRDCLLNTIKKDSLHYEEYKS